MKTLSREDVLEIYQIRCTLERMAAEIVLDKGDRSAIGELEEKLKEVEEGPVADLYEMIGRDLEFHRALVTASGSERLLELWERLVSELRFALSLVDPSFSSRLCLANPPTTSQCNP